MALISNGTTVASGGTVRGSASNLTSIPAPSNSAILSGVASASYDGVGSYAWVIDNNGGYTLSGGSTFTGFGLTGTWRYMKQATISGSNNNNTTREWLCMRIS